MGVSAMEPINTRAPAVAARAYIQLGWPVFLGHRWRPRQGCTCDSPGCPAPGAHPVLPGVEPLGEESVEDALETAPGASLIAATRQFDAVLVPHRIGMATMAWLDRSHPVPCLVTDSNVAALLVLPATGRYAAVHACVEVRTGEDGWIALPPSHGTRWDTPPWLEATRTPRELLNGQEVGRHLREVIRMSTVARSRGARR
jgi:hypothetical protein